MVIPGRSFTGALPPLTDTEISRAGRLRQDIEALADGIGERNTETPEQLSAAATYLEARFLSMGYSVHRETYSTGGIDVANIVAEKKGREIPEEIVVIGAHYDTFPGSPGADDNASGIAGLLEIARGLSGTEARRSLRCVAFVNEEPPYFQTEQMGSRVHARGCRKRKEKIVAMLCLECLGYYSDEPGSQSYPALLERYYPNIADFIAFCSNLASYPLLRKVVKTFRSTTKFPSEGLVAPERLAEVGWSDHWSFWQEQYPAIMITDTAFLRNRHYHRASDRPDTLDYERMARVVGGIDAVIELLVR
jgi:hypothetical protein